MLSALSRVLMRQLRFPDRHYLEAAGGWMLLGNLIEARVEVDQISPLGRLQPQAMLVRWQVYIRLAEVDHAHHLARAFTRLCPSLPAGWMCLSYTLYQMNRSEEAWEVLLSKVHRFPKFSGIPYLLACYAWKTGSSTEARRWLARSAALGGPATLDAAALDDSSRLMASGASMPLNSGSSRATQNRLRGSARDFRHKPSG
jgi:predicted Zn-dependent protease